jgi:hypothetical protein
MSIKIIGSISTNIAEVDANNNVLVNTPGYDATGVERGGGSENAGAVAMFSENDGGTVTGTRSVKSPETSVDYRLRVGLDTILFNDTFNAITQNTNNWRYIFATLTASQPGAGTLNFGTVQGTAITHGAIMKTFQYFPVVGTAPLSVEFKFGSFIATLVADEEWRAGLGDPTVAGTAPTDGVWYKLTSAGLIGELAYNGVATQTGVLLPVGDITNGTISKFVIVIGEGEVEFWKDDVLLGEITIPVANGQPFIQGTLPAFMQKLCTGNVTNTNTIRVSDATVSLLDIASNKPWSEQLSGMGQSGNLGQNGNTQGKTSLWGNSTAPTATVMNNTTAIFTGLGGIVAVLPTLVVGTDGKMLTYQNPTSTVNITGRNLIITGLRMQGAVSVALTGGAVAYAMAIAYGHTSTSLATTETASFVTATTHAPRIMPLGFQSFPITSAVGTTSTHLETKFTTPIVIRPGEFFDIVARNVGIVTSAGAITFTIGIDSYWE